MNDQAEDSIFESSTVAFPMMPCMVADISIMDEHAVDNVSAEHYNVHGNSY